MSNSETKPVRAKSRSLAFRRVGLASLTLLVAGGLGALIMVTGPDGAAQEQTEKAWPISVVRATPAELHPMFATYGRVEARSQVELRANVNSTVEEVLVKEGDWAEQGELLVKLRQDEIKLRLREAQAEENQQEAALKSIESQFEALQTNSSHFDALFEVSKHNLERQKKLADQKMIPQSLYENAVQTAARDAIEYQAHVSSLKDFPNRIRQQHAELEKAQVRVDQSKLDLAKTEIRAPFAGPVLAVAANLGNNTSLGGLLVTMADASSFEIRAAIPDQYADRIRSHLDDGVTVVATTTTRESKASNASRLENLHLNLTRITRNVRVGQGGLDAFFSFQADQLAGARVPEIGRVLSLNTVLPAEAELIALPTQAIYENNRVYTVNNNRLQAVNVERVGEFQDTDGSYKILIRGNAAMKNSEIMTTQLPKAITGLLVEPIRKLDEAVVNHRPSEIALAAVQLPKA